MTTEGALGNQERLKGVPRGDMNASEGPAAPVRMLATLHMGFHVSGWKSDIERQRRMFVAKRPLGVYIFIEGGL